MVPLGPLIGLGCAAWAVHSSRAAAAKKWDDLTWDDPPKELLRGSGAGAIPRIETLGKPQDDKARSLLYGLAVEVEPLMKRHNLKVPQLEELEPRFIKEHRVVKGQYGGLSLVELDKESVGSTEFAIHVISIKVESRGQDYATPDMVTSRRVSKICVALRELHSPASFRSKQAILDIMAGQLANCTFEQYEPKFKELEAQYKQELEEQKRRRVAGRLRSWAAQHQWPAVGKEQAGAKCPKAGGPMKGQQVLAGSSAAEPNLAVRIAMGMLAAGALAAADRIHKPKTKKGGR